MVRKTVMVALRAWPGVYVAITNRCRWRRRNGLLVRRAGARSAPQDVSEDELSEDEQDAAEVEAPATAAGGDSDDSDSEAA